MGEELILQIEEDKVTTKIDNNTTKSFNELVDKEFTLL
jgi:hypothetical protein